MLPNWYSYKTHAHVTGTSQSGKSKFSELCIREHVKRGTGLTLLDWHGNLYHEVIEYLAYLGVTRPVYLLNPSEPDYVLPYDPFALPDGWDVSAHVARMTDLIVKPWGGEGTNQLPTFERIVKMVLHFCAVSGEPLHHGAKLLEYPKKELREWAISLIDDDYIKQQWKQLQYVRTFDQWLRQVESTQNRLGRFIGSKPIKLFTGLGSVQGKLGPGFSIARAIEKRAIVLVNLKPSRDFPPESGKVFAALLLAGFLQAALDRSERPVPHFLYLDECQNYLSTDAAVMLDQVLKTGLRLTLAHHHLGQFHEKLHLQQSIEMNAKIKVIFAGLPVESAKRNAEEFFLPKLNERWKKQDRFRTVTEFYEDSSMSVTETHGSGPGGASDSQSSTSSSRLVPFQRLEPDGQEDWSREEKVSKLAEDFQSLERGECYVRLPDKTYRYQVPFVRRYLPNPDKIVRFMEDVQKTYVPLHEAEQILKEKERAFLERSRDYVGSGRPKKREARPAHLHPQS